MKNWKGLFDGHRLHRGLEYYDWGNVVELKKNELGYQAIVEGSEDYHVSIYSKDYQHVDDMECDCLDFNNGFCCKHLAATLYAIDEVQNTQEDNNVSINNSIEDIIDKLSEKEVKDYLRMIIRSDYSKANDFKFRFARYYGNTGLKNEIIAYYSNYDEKYYYDYDDELYDEVVDKSGNFVDKIKLLIKNGILDESLECIKAAIQSINDIENYDDYLADIYNDFLFLIDDIIAYGNIEKNLQLFNWSLSELSNIGDLYDVAINVFEQLAYLDDYYFKALNFVDEQLDDDIVDDYILKFKYKSLDDVESFVDKFYESECIKKLYLDDLIKDNQYLKAIKVLIDLRGDEIYSYRNNYTLMIIEYYQKAGLIEEAIEEAKNLLINHSNLEYYQLLKDLYGDEWLKYRDNILEILKDNNVKVLDFYREEGMVDELFAACKDDFYQLYNYRDLLKDKYGNELTMATIDDVFYQSKETSSRDKYYYIAMKINSLLDYGNDQALINDIVYKLINKYPKRRAFKEELMKVVK